jgi:hypothetical protein
MDFRLKLENDGGGFAASFFIGNYEIMKNLNMKKETHLSLFFRRLSACGGVPEFEL